jgi:putative ATP-binding cassette transporter
LRNFSDGKGKVKLVRDTWRVAKPYWTSEEKWSAWGLLLAVLALNLGNVPEPA